MIPRHLLKLVCACLACALALVPSARAEDGATNDISDPIAGREHWAFRPLSEPRPPAVASSDWPRSPIDSFILAKLEAAHLRPAPDADRRTLLRRIHFQLIGLPPTPEQVAAFWTIQRPDAHPQRAWSTSF